MKSIQSRALRVVMAAVLALGLMPSVALAEPEGNSDGGGVTLTRESVTVTDASGLQNAITNASDGDVIILGSDISATLSSFTDGKSLTFDLGGHTLTLTNTAGLSVDNGATITFANGTLVSNDLVGNANEAVIGVTSGSSVTLDKVTFNTDVTGLLARGDAAALNIINGSVINATGYCLGTNAEKTDNYDVVINLEDSVFNASSASNASGTAMYINVPGILNIDNCTINGYFHGLIVRGGTAVIKNSTITNTVSNGGYANAFDGESWGNGNRVNIAALTMGNKILSGANNYDYPTNVTLENTTITSAGENANVYPAVYAWANTGSDKGVTVSYDNCTINGAVIYGNDGANITSTVQNGVAQIGNTDYLTLADAISAAQDGETITLQRDTIVNSSIVISDGRQLTLDMNGHDVGFALLKNISIYHGGLNIIGSGKLYETKPYYAPVMLYGSNEDVANYTTVTVGEGVTLEGWAGLFVDQLESNSNGANAYGIVATVYGTLHSTRDIYEAGGHAFYLQGIIKATSGNVPKIILDGATLNTDEGNGMYLAGYADTTITNTNITADTGIEIRAGKLTVNDGTVITANGTPTSVTPNGNGSTTDGAGIAVAQHTTKLPIDVNISGGTIEGFTALYESNPQNNSAEDISKVKLSVTGGNFQSVNGGTVSVYSEDKTGFISGGTFSSDPSAYVASGRVALAQNGQYVVQVKSENAAPAEVVAGAPTSDVEAIPEGSRDAVKKAVNAIQATGLTGEANAEANANTVTREDGQTELENAGINVSNADEVTIVVQPYLYIEATEYVPSGATKSMTLDITPMVRTVATTADPTEGEGIYLEDEGQNVKNAVVVEEGERLNVTTPITLSIPLPSGFVSNTDDIYVQHKGYQYTATVTENDSGDGGYTATFTNPHGFSEFTISTASKTVATLNGTNYTDFQAAVNAAQDGETITIPADAALEGNSLAATISGSTDKGVIVKNETNSSISVTINGATKTIAAGGQDTFAYTAPSTGVGGGGGGAAAAEEYEVTVAPTSHGTVTAEPSKAAEGDTVTLTVSPDEGYELTHLSVLDADKAEVELAQNADGTYSFEMPASEAAVYAVFSCDGGELCPSHGFADVDQSQWYHEAIDWAVANKVLNGFDDTGLMAPDGDVTRAQMAQILWNVEGRPAVDYAAGFGDVAEGDWFYQAVAWAASEGIFKGYDDGSGLFGPNDVLTREQAAAVLMRWTEANGGDVSARADLSAYPDVDGVSAWAAESGCVSWAVAAGVISGVEQEDGSLLLDPTGTATRAQTAMLMMRLTAE